MQAANADTSSNHLRAIAATLYECNEVDGRAAWDVFWELWATRYCGDEFLGVEDCTRGGPLP
jgi:hypothetical protein